MARDRSLDRDPPRTRADADVLAEPSLSSSGGLGDRLAFGLPHLAADAPGPRAAPGARRLARGVRADDRDRLPLARRPLRGLRPASGRRRPRGRVFRGCDDPVAARVAGSVRLAAGRHLPERRRASLSPQGLTPRPSRPLLAGLGPARSADPRRARQARERSPPSGRECGVARAAAGRRDEPAAAGRR
jgi:hypothetical protein